MPFDFSAYGFVVCVGQFFCFGPELRLGLIFIFTSSTTALLFASVSSMLAWSFSSASSI